MRGLQIEPVDEEDKLVPDLDQHRHAAEFRQDAWRIA
jgi:hypothetical protein